MSQTAKFQHVNLFVQLSKGCWYLRPTSCSACVITRLLCMTSKASFAHPILQETTPHFYRHSIVAGPWPCLSHSSFWCSLDTGRLNPETYKLFHDVEKRYNIRIEYTFPDAQETIDLVREKGMFSFYEDGHQECCRVRKVSRCHITLSYQNWSLQNLHSTKARLHFSRYCTVLYCAMVIKTMLV